NTNGRRSTVCDPTCTGGQLRGNVCNLDTDCTSCNVSVKTCVPEPVSAWIGDPKSTLGSVAHATIVANLLTSGGKLPLKQCTVAGNVGQMCDVANCATGSCSGTPCVCTSGADLNKLSCNNAGATCAVRSPSAYIRFADPGSSISFIDNGIEANQMI